MNVGEQSFIEQTDLEACGYYSDVLVNNVDSVTKATEAFNIIIGQFALTEDCSWDVDTPFNGQYDMTTELNDNKPVYMR